MKAMLLRFTAHAAMLVAVLALAAGAFAAPPAVTAHLDRSEVALGESAQLTFTMSGNGQNDVSPSAVQGLEFVAVGRSSQMQSVNGVTTSTTSVTYDVIPQRAGTFTIRAPSPGAMPLTLTVRPGSGRGAAVAGSGSGASSLPPPATGGLAAGRTHLTKDGSAFARLLLPTRDLYVGEAVPVDIQVGLRPGLVASLDGLPTLNADAFTLNKLSPQPEQTETTIAGTPYTLLTWHSILAAVKPGTFSLTVDTPLTVQMRTAPSRRPDLPPGFADASIFGDPFNDPFFQNFFGGTTQKQITVTSDPDVLKVLALPTAGRPAGFGGAVGQFEVSSDLSAATSAAGDPITLRLRVKGKGDFDRVNSTMLGETSGWKTYPPSAKFAAADSVGYSGEKDFEQAVIAAQPGRQTVPALSFSYFNPETGKYESKLTAPVSVDVSAAPAGSVATTYAPVSEPPRDGLHPDHVETGSTVTTLRLLYFQPWFLSSQSVLSLGFAVGFLVLRRRERRAKDIESARRREASNTIERRLAEMDAAAAAGDSMRFFQAARAALQEQLSTRWRVAPASITIAEIDARANGDGAGIRRIFERADQAAYSGQHLSTADFEHWKDDVRGQLKEAEQV